MKKIDVNFLEPSKQQLNDLLEYYQAGRYVDAEKLSLSITQEFPKHQFGWKVLAAVLKQKGRISESLVASQKSVELGPLDVEAHNNLGIALQELGKSNEAETSYRKAITIKPDYAEAHSNLGIILKELGRLDEAEASFRQSIVLKSDSAKAHNNLGTTLKELGRLDEAETSYRKAITIKPDYAEAHSNLGIILKELERLDESETSYRKAITIKPDLAEAHSNLGIILKELERLDESEASLRQAIALKPDLAEAHYNLGFLLRRKELLVNISRAKKDEIKNNLKSANVSSVSSNLRLTSNPFISNMKVEAELVSQLYKISSKKLDDVDLEYLRYGNGKSSDYELFENNFSTIKTVAKDLVNIMKEAVKSDIFIMESFFNIFQTESGIISHNHVSAFDYNSGLLNQKFSLTYYLDIGDQNCSEPGILKLEDPDEEILPTEGMIVIFPANRRHSAIYNGRKDRVMIGVNFYSLL